MVSPNKCITEIGKESELMKEQIFGCYFFSQVSILELLYGPPTVLSRSTSDHFGTGFTSAGQFEVFWSEFDVSTAVDTSWLSSLVASVAEIVCVG
jgi:hypothetical protein